MKRFRRARHRSALRSPSQEENEDRKQKRTRNGRVSLQRRCGSLQLPWPLKLRSSLSISPGKKLRRDLDLSETLSLDRSRVSTNFPGSFEVPNETDCSDIRIKTDMPIQYQLFVRLGSSEPKDNSVQSGNNYQVKVDITYLFRRMHILYIHIIRRGTRRCFNFDIFPAK